MLVLNGDEWILITKHANLFLCAHCFTLKFKVVWRVHTSKDNPVVCSPKLQRVWLILNAPCPRPPHLTDNQPQKSQSKIATYVPPLVQTVIARAVLFHVIWCVAQSHVAIWWSFFDLHSSFQEDGLPLWAMLGYRWGQSVCQPLAGALNSPAHTLKHPVCVMSCMTLCVCVHIWEGVGGLASFKPCPFLTQWETCTTRMCANCGILCLIIITLSFCCRRAMCRAGGVEG